MHHITLHKSRDDVHVTYKDVKFNVMRARAKSGCLAAPEYDAFRSAITSRTWYVSTAWCINIDHLISYDAKKTEPRTSGARAAENPTRVTLHPGWEITGPRLPWPSTVHGRKSDLREVTVDCLRREHLRDFLITMLLILILFILRPYIKS